MIRRTRDVEFVNRLLARDFGDLDFTEALANPLNVCLVEAENGVIFAWRGPRIYEVHVFYASRGRDALKLSERMLDVMRMDYGARLFWGLVPLESRKVRMFTRLMGWWPEGVLETQHGPCELFVSEKYECLQQ